jgi:hypothetical protein
LSFEFDDLPSEEEIQRYLDDNDDRHYTNGEDDVYSVTTILDKEHESEPPWITNWKENNDGRGDNADWQHILEYKQNRGTLAHYAALSQLEDKHPHDDQLWSGDERQSLNQIMDRVGDVEFLYSILKDRGMIESRHTFEPVKDEIDLTDILYDDLGYFKDQFADTMLSKGVTPRDVMSVEHMFALPENEEAGHAGYGGQADMIYEDPETGEHVVIDLKTSKDVYDKHKKQLSAYSQAAMESPEMNGDYIDRAEVWRFFPDEEESEIYVMDDHKKYWDDFAELSNEAYG